MARLAAYGWLATLVLVLALFAWPGERAWPVAALLYLPRAFFALPLLAIAPALWITGQRWQLWTQAACAVLVVFPLMGLRLVVPVDRPGGAVLRVLAWNVKLGRAGEPSSIAREIRSAAPDVVVFVAPSSAALAALSGVLPDFRVARLDAFAVASRHPVRPVRAAAELATRSGAPFAQFRVESPLGPIEVFAVHPLSPRGAFRSLRGLRTGLLGGQARRAFIDDEERRSRALRSLADEAARSPNPVLLAGDFNSPSRSRVFAEAMRGFRDAFEEAGSGFGYTFPARPFLAFLRLDRILAGPGLRFVAFKVGGNGGSDHRPIYADIVGEQ